MVKKRRQLCMQAVGDDQGRAGEGRAASHVDQAVTDGRWLWRLEEARELQRTRQSTLVAEAAL